MNYMHLVWGLFDLFLLLFFCFNVDTNFFPPKKGEGEGLSWIALFSFLLLNEHELNIFCKFGAFLNIKCWSKFFFFNDWLTFCHRAFLLVGIVQLKMSNIYDMVQHCFHLGLINRLWLYWGTAWRSLFQWIDPVLFGIWHYYRTDVVGYQQTNFLRR